MLSPLIRYILFIILDETGRHQAYAYDNTAKDKATKAEIMKDSLKTDTQQNLLYRPD